MSSAEVEKRREIVARWRLEGKSIREITLDLFDKEGIYRTRRVNGVEEQVPYSESTVKKDLVILRNRWREDALDDTKTLRGEQLAVLRLIRRKAMEGKDYAVALRTVDSEMKLTGTAEAIKVRHEFEYERELEQAGYDPERTFEQFVEAYRVLESAEQAGVSGAGGGGGSSAGADEAAGE